MRQMEFLSELDTTSIEGLTRFFRFAMALRNNDADRTAVMRLEKRFGLGAYEPKNAGALEEFVSYLEGLERNQRFTAAYNLISGVLGDKDRLDGKVADELLKVISDKPVVRLSFAPGLLLCLRHAHEPASNHRVRHYADYEIRYAGIGPEKVLMSFASLFLNLPIYTETNPPWQPDAIFDSEFPNAEASDVEITFPPEAPDFEIAFPPTVFHSSDAPHLEASVRRSKLPRAVERGKFDIESVMLAYLCEADAPSVTFVSNDFLASTKQSRLLTRQRLLSTRRIQRVAEINTVDPSQFLIETCGVNFRRAAVQMVSANTVRRFIGTEAYLHQVRGKSENISVDSIEIAGSTLTPTRYLGRGPAGGSDPAARISNALTPTRYLLADLFEITRPKTTRNDPVGTLPILEVSGSNISEHGEIYGALRTLNVRATLQRSLAEQCLKPGDILFAHRGPIGRVAYITEAYLDVPIWAGQTMLIFRERKRSSNAPDLPYCDPRVLFMYLLTDKVRARWKELSINKRSPSLPIGEVESFALPENLLTATKPKKASSSQKPDSPLSCRDAILSEFNARQNDLLELRKIEAKMNDGLDRVWETAWMKS